MHRKSITRKCESECATHSARKPMRSLTPSLSCRACRPRDPNFWKKSMLNAVNQNNSFMQRSSNVGQFQLHACVYHVSPATSFLFLNLLEFLIRFILSPRTPRRAFGCSGKQCAHRTHTWHSKHMRMCTRACTNRAEPTYAREHARFRVQVRTHACTKTLLHSRMRARMDIRINTTAPMSTRPHACLQLTILDLLHHLSKQPRSFLTSVAATTFCVAFGKV